MAGAAKRPAIKLVEKPEPEAEPAGGYGKVEPPYWGTVAIVGGGPSLIDFDYERLRGATVLAVKGAMFSIPWADAGFGFGEMPAKVAAAQGRVYWAVDEGQQAPANVTMLRRLDGADVGDDPGAVHDGGTSGFGAFQIAMHKRATRIVLFGFDYDGEVGRNLGEGTADYHRRREKDLTNWNVRAERFRVFVPRLAAAGVSVINACPTSAISCFQKATVEDGVSALR